MKLSYKFKV